MLSPSVSFALPPLSTLNYAITKLTSLLDTGANASAEEAAEEIEDGAVQVNNVVNTFRLQSTSFDKKSYLSHLKGTFRSHRISIGATVLTPKQDT